MFAQNKRIFLTLQGSSANTRGFTLVEVMIVVAIIAILGAIAVPQYRNYITSSRLGAANSVLEQIPVLLETFRAENGRFPLTGVYAYTEAANGTVTSNTIISGNGLVAGGAGLRDFAPRPKTLPATQGIQFNYSLTITNSATVNEAATFSATGVGDAAGINAAGTYR